MAKRDRSEYTDEQKERCCIVEWLFNLRATIGKGKFAVPQDEIRLAVSQASHDVLYQRLKQVDGAVCACGCGDVMDIHRHWKPVFIGSSLGRFCGCEVVIVPEVEGYDIQIISEAVEINEEYVAQARERQKQEAASGALSDAFRNNAELYADQAEKAGLN